jgi:phospholipid-translocating ATPase
MGAVLLQEKEGLLHPVQYASKKLSQAQQRYSTVERECLAIVWGLTKFSRFVLGRPFVLQTDHRPLTFLKSAKTKNNRLLRWALMIQEFNFEVEPIPGQTNIIADMLSRDNESAVQV